MTTLYVAGPMRGRPKFNFPLFDEVAAALRRKGFGVINPADMDRERQPDIEKHPVFQTGDMDRWAEATGFDFHRVIGQDLVAIIQDADGIVMLPEWETSIGAGHEKYVAEATGKTVQYAYKTGQGHWLFLDFDLYARERLHSVRRVEGEDLEELEALHHRYRTFDDLAQPTSTVIGLMGYAQSGKDTLANMLVAQHGYTRLAFADLLRECLYVLNPLLPGGERVKDVVNRKGWDWSKVNIPEIRELLQRLGTDMGRELLGNDIWVEATLRKVQDGGKFVITDMRFPNEFAAVEKLGGRTVRIMRPGFGPVNNHWSETALDGYTASLLVWNTGTPEDMLQALKIGVAL